MSQESLGEPGRRGMSRRRALAAGVGSGVGLGAWALGSGTAAAEAASQTTVDPSGLQIVSGTNVQDAIGQLDQRLEGTFGGMGVMNVRDYGAVGDGVTNDLPAVIDAVMAEKPSSDPIEWVPRFDRDVGGVLYFPPGVYFLQGVMIMWFNKLHVVGAGAPTTTLLFKQSGYVGDPDWAPKLWLTDPRFDRRINDVSVRDLTIRTDLLLDGNDPRNSGDTALKVYRADRVRITGVEVADSPSFGMSIWECTDVVIDKCHVHDTHMDGIHLSKTDRAVVHACRVDHTGDDGIAVGNPDNNTAHLNVDSVLVEGNLVAECRNGYFSAARASDVKASGPTGIVVYQDGNDVNGLAIAPTTTPA